MVEINTKTVIIGGGIAGMSTASHLAKLGLPSVIIESEPKLGGHLKDHYKLFPHHKNASELLDEMLSRVTDNPKIEVLTNTRVTGISGEFGAFQLNLSTKSEGDSESEQTIEAGAVVVATGFDSIDANKLHEYSYHLNKNIITGLEFEKLLAEAKESDKTISRPSDGGAPKNAAVILCTGSRDEKFNEFCCEVGCRAGLNHAFQLKEMFGDDIQVFVCYIDIRANGKDNEVFYRQVREKDVHFIRGRPSELSNIDENYARFNVFDQVTHKLLQIESDLIILETALVPPEAQAALNDALKLESDDTGFLAIPDYYHPCSSPVKGIFYAGTATGPKDIPNTQAHAALAATEIAELLKE